MFTAPQLLVLLLIAVLGHAMALLWYLAVRNKWRISERTIYDLPINEKQMRREFRNSLHTPTHAVILGGFLYLGFFQTTGIASFLLSATATFVWAEIWHYASHRAFHLKPLHWIHAEHHKSHLNSPFTAISFSFSEKLIFDLGLLGAAGRNRHAVQPELLWNCRVVRRLSHYQFVQPCEFRIEVEGLQSLAGPHPHQHHVSFAASLPVHRQLRARNRASSTACSAPNGRITNGCTTAFRSSTGHCAA